MEKEGIFLHPNDHKRKSDWITIFGMMDNNMDYKKINSSLDLGGGLGDISYHVLKNNPNSQVICVDNDPVLLAQASKRSPNLKIMTYDINKKLPFESKSFDLVSCLGTLHYYYIADPKNVFSEIVRVSKKYIVVDFFYKYRLWYFLLKIRHPHYNPRRYVFSEIKSLIEKYNLKIIDKIGTRNPFGKFFPSFGRTTVFLLEKND